MIHVLIGTKGQLIKMAPIMLELEKRNIEYNFIHTGQHTEITERIMKIFNLKPPNMLLERRASDVTEVGKGILWGSKNILKYSVKIHYVFKPKEGICLVHGDAFPAVQGLILAKLARIKVGHVEAGERTYNIFDPFPEEIIRVIVDRMSHLLFASSTESEENLRKEKVKGRIINVGFNTVYDSVRVALNKNPVLSIPNHPYALVAIHRMETIMLKEKMELIVSTVEKAAQRLPVIFVLYESTKKCLVHFELYQKLKENPRVTIIPLQDYISFMHLIKNSQYMITDGGGPQQETQFMNVPCLLMRRETERLNYPNVCFTQLKTSKIEEFLRNPEKYRSNEKMNIISPSKKIVDILLQEGYA